MKDHNSASFKKLTLDLFSRYPKINKIIFYTYPKPQKKDHILNRLKYKNDNGYRIFVLLETGQELYQEFLKQSDIINFLDFYYQIITLNAPGFNNPALIPEYCKNEMIEQVFYRSQHEKLLNLK